jgi:hypothetical protein
MTRLTNEISVLKFVRADRSSEFYGLLAQILAREPSRSRGSYFWCISITSANLLL